jgi:hypothetical protein
LNALDDPIVPGKIIPYSQIISNPNIVIATTCYGGHLGWYSNLILPKRWFSKPVSEFIVALSTALSSLPKQNDIIHFKEIMHPNDIISIKNASIQTQTSLEFTVSENSVDSRDKQRPVKFFPNTTSQLQSKLARSSFFKPWKMASLIAILSFLIRYWRGRK